ncbi:ACP phosphodiesterase [Scytonema hofmannii PCC 7110]|uniref:ACP phosphodiesterase n=1 Tax=Scytonema hofmannii PCC 7110 TaxID=128403 RepID=A0A139WRW0_9CYAN|nr:ACP phosphodiesterase [Scytonema hofmannii]KYC35171.1 ACP phosphodiesterase [Scytonema hofmannii PCC 7110]
MNWLAHLFLSEKNVESRLGNLLADLVKGSARQDLNFGIQRGMECHKVVDTFTDCHVIVRCSKGRISQRYKRFAGILVDIFYDYFLAKNWSVYSNIPLDEFTTQIYESFQAYPGQIPTPVREILNRMAAEDWLGSYRNLAGVEKTIRRISHRLSMRLSKPFSLNLAVSELITHESELENDFREFFPELLAHTQNWHLA